MTITTVILWVLADIAFWGAVIGILAAAIIKGIPWAWRKGWEWGTRP